MELEPLAARIREHGTAERAVRPVGGGTKLGWGSPGPEGAVDVETGGLDEILEHNVGDFTAVLGERRLRLRERHARLEYGGEVADVVLEDAVQTAGLQRLLVAGGHPRRGAAAGRAGRPVGAREPLRRLRDSLRGRNRAARPAASSGCSR